MAFNRITDDDLIGKGVIGLPDTPQLSTDKMQEKFEETVRSVVIPHFNELIGSLEGTEAAGTTGVTVPTGFETDPNLQAVLNEFGAQIKENTANRHSHENKETLDAITPETKEGYDNLVEKFSGVEGFSNEMSGSSVLLPTEKAVAAYVDSKGNVYSAYNSFPRPGEEGKMYVDTFSNPRKIYTWDSGINDYSLTGGAGGGEESAEATVDATVQLTTAGWAADSGIYVQTAHVAGMTRNAAFVFAQVTENDMPTDAEVEAFSLIYGVSQGYGVVTFYAYEIPEVDIVVRAFSGAGTADGTAGSGSLPDGGTAGQILTKESDIDGDAVWKDLPSTLEITENKVSEIGENSTDTQYPTAKAVYSAMLGALVQVNAMLGSYEKTVNKVAGIDDTANNDEYPTTLAVKTYVDTVLGVIENGSY